MSTPLSRRAPRTRLRVRRPLAAARDAIAVLKADHREIDTWFDDFARTEDRRLKMELATRICGALRVHTTIEEEIFYPAFLKATLHRRLHHDAIVEHGEAKNLVGEIERSDPGDDFYDSRMKVLADLVRRHVREEEKPHGLFELARRSRMDLAALGQVLEARKNEFLGPYDREPDE